MAPLCRLCSGTGGLACGGEDPLAGVGECRPHFGCHLARCRGSGGKAGEGQGTDRGPPTTMAPLPSGGHIARCDRGCVLWRRVCRHCEWAQERVARQLPAWWLCAAAAAARLAPRRFGEEFEEEVGEGQFGEEEELAEEEEEKQQEYEGERGGGRGRCPHGSHGPGPG